MAVPPLDVSPPALALVNEALVALAVVPPLPPLLPVVEPTSAVPELVVVTVVVAVSDVALVPLVVPWLFASPALEDSGAGLSEEHAAAAHPTTSSEPINNGLNTLSSYYGSRPAPSRKFVCMTGSCFSLFDAKENRDGAKH